jgi:hypothetical protein
MRAACLTVCLLLFAVSAAAETHRPECRQLEQRIERLEHVGEVYEARGNDAFADRADVFVDRLNARRHQLGCPETLGEATARRIAQIVDLIAKGAITFFTMGMAPTPI